MLTGPGLYIHLPWCVKKCPYCDFNSHPLKTDSSFIAYTDALIKDLQHQLAPLQGIQFASIFFGGGTPSLFPAELLQKVLAVVPLQTDAEITMEANPGTTEYLDFATYRQAGINRLSLGAQSFSATQLQQLGRIHSPQQVEQAFENARDGGFQRINLDLMWGLPGQSVEQALLDLETAIDLSPEHISWYQLTIEAKTEFARRPPVLPVEDVLSDIEDAGLAYLQAAGFQRYEISAYAKTPQARCRHNLNYWQFGDYVGAGAGAHGKWSQAVGLERQIWRTSRAASPRAYQADPITLNKQAIERSVLIGEFMLNALRLVDGVSQQHLTDSTGVDWSEVSPTWQRLVDMELVQPERCVTTPLGLRYLDSVVAEFI